MRQCYVVHKWHFDCINGILIAVSTQKVKNSIWSIWWFAIFDFHGISLPSRLDMSSNVIPVWIYPKLDWVCWVDNILTFSWRKQLRGNKGKGQKEWEKNYKLAAKKTPSKTAIAWLLINVSKSPTASNCVFVWFCDVLWLNNNNGPTVSWLHWDIFLSPSLYQQLSCWGTQTGYFRSTLEEQHSIASWIQMLAQSICFKLLEFLSMIKKTKPWGHQNIK